MFTIPYVQEKIDFDRNRVVNSIRDHVEKLKVPNPWPKQSQVISSLAAGGEDAWQDEELFKQINPIIVKFLKESMGINVKVQCHMWYNVYNDGYMQEAHAHHGVGSLGSGIIYVRFPKGSTGTTFLIPMRHFFNACQYKEEFTMFTPKVTEGDCIIFPPWLEHRVDKQVDIPSSRITVAFNILASN